MRGVVALLVVGCAGSQPAGSFPPDEAVVEMEAVRGDVSGAGAVRDMEAPAVGIPSVSATARSATATVMGAGVRSVELVKTTVVFVTPDVEGERAGIIRKGTRTGVQAAREGGAGCAARWLLLEPRGWVCEDQVSASIEGPTAATTVSLADEYAADDPLVPGTYGTVRGKGVMAYASAADARAGVNARPLVGSNSVRSRGAVTIDGERFWRTSGGELIPESSIARFSPSRFQGVVIGEWTAMPAWVRSADKPKEPVRTYAEPSAGARSVGSLPPRTVVAVEEESGRFVRISEGMWVRRADVRVAAVVAPPPGTGSSEKWFDIDLDEQVLVAYEGERPVYATLVSTGKYGHSTPALVSRIATKHERTTMTSSKNEIYSVADVPWTMFYDKSFALHTAYWHDGFGKPRSHGCVNLAPRDARLLYHWSSPDIPPGWVTVYGNVENPGSLVRVRTSKNPSPRFRGYARDLVAPTTVASN